MNHHDPHLLKILLLALAVIAAVILPMASGFLLFSCPGKAESVMPPEEMVVSCLSVPDDADVSILGLSSPEIQEPVHILLIGQDQREGESGARADAILLCSFLPEENQLVLTSFLRDLYVDIPGHQSDRINAAYAYGGIPLLRQTMEDNFDLTLSGCIEVDFSRFAQVVDALGGVTIRLRQDEAEAINEAVPGTLKEGDNLLDGPQALAYTRIRNLDRDGDFSRTGRQRMVLTALLDRFQNASLRSLLSTMLEILPMLSTDMERQQLVSLIFQLFPMLSDAGISSQRIPADGTFSYATIRGMAVLEADMDAARQLLAESFQPKDVPSIGNS